MKPRYAVALTLLLKAPFHGVARPPVCEKRSRSQRKFLYVEPSNSPQIFFTSYECICDLKRPEIVANQQPQQLCPVDTSHADTFGEFSCAPGEATCSNKCSPCRGTRCDGAIERPHFCRRDTLAFVVSFALYGVAALNKRTFIMRSDVYSTIARSPCHHHICKAFGFKQLRYQFLKLLWCMQAEMANQGRSSNWFF